MKLDHSRSWRSRWAVLGFCSALFSSAMAGDPVMEQKLFSLALNLTPNVLFRIQRISGEIPVTLLTDSAGSIAAIRLGNDTAVVRTLKSSGETEEQGAGEALLSSEFLSRKKFRVNMDSPVRNDQELFSLDASQLNAETGGPITLRYVDSLMLGTLHTIHFELIKFQGRWTAKIRETSLFGRTTESYVRKVELGTGVTGLSLSSPEYVFFDPNQIISLLRPKRLADPREATVLVKDSESKVRQMEGVNYELHGGVTIHVTTVPVGR